jgi:hypothetical protein
MTLEKFSAYDPPITLKNNSVAISDALSAAMYSCTPSNYPANDLLGPVQDRWLCSKEYKIWRASMPAKTPKKLRAHQSEPSKCNPSEISALIGSCGDLLERGQFLFHAGVMPSQKIRTTKPLSTSISPGPAFSNGLWRGKAGHVGNLDLGVLEITSNNVCAFVYKHRGNVKFKQELEVLLPSGVLLTPRRKTIVSRNFRTGDANGRPRTIIVNVVHVCVS